MIEKKITKQISTMYYVPVNTPVFAAIIIFACSLIPQFVVYHYHNYYYASQNQTIMIVPAYDGSNVFVNTSTPVYRPKLCSEIKQFPLPPYSDLLHINRSCTCGAELNINMSFIWIRKDNTFMINAQYDHLRCEYEQFVNKPPLEAVQYLKQHTDYFSKSAKVSLSHYSLYGKHSGPAVLEFPTRIELNYFNSTTCVVRGLEIRAEQDFDLLKCIYLCLNLNNGVNLYQLSTAAAAAVADSK
jgi:hypothetical protein